MIFDWTLRIAALLFFGISWLYAWGLINLFGDDPKRDRWFLWDWASVMGIAVTTSITYVIVWQIRRATGYQLTWNILEQNVFDLLVMFSSALFAMRYVRVRLVEQRRKWYAELTGLRKENEALKDRGCRWYQELRDLRKENRILREQIEAKKNHEIRIEQHFRSLSVFVENHMTLLKIPQQAVEIITPIEVEGI